MIRWIGTLFLVVFPLWMAWTAYEAGVEKGRAQACVASPGNGGGRP